MACTLSNHRLENSDEWPDLPIARLIEPRIVGVNNILTHLRQDNPITRELEREHDKADVRGGDFDAVTLSMWGEA